MLRVSYRLSLERWKYVWVGKVHSVLRRILSQAGRIGNGRRSCIPWLQPGAFWHISVRHLEHGVMFCGHAWIGTAVRPASCTGCHTMSRRPDVALGPEGGHPMGRALIALRAQGVLCA